MATIDELLDALTALEEGGEAKATSVRIPEALHRAVLLATELGMDESFTSATTRALHHRLQGFLRGLAIAEHLRAFPADIPTLASVAHRRVQGSPHPGASRPELIDDAAAWVEKRWPDWAVSGSVDEAVDEVLGYVEMLAAGVGRRRPRSA